MYFKEDGDFKTYVGIYLRGSKRFVQTEERQCILICHVTQVTTSDVVWTFKKGQKVWGTVVYRNNPLVKVPD